MNEKIFVRIFRFERRTRTNNSNEKFEQKFKRKLEWKTRMKNSNGKNWTKNANEKFEQKIHTQNSNEKIRTKNSKWKTRYPWQLTSHGVYDFYKMGGHILVGLCYPWQLGSHGKFYAGGTQISRVTQGDRGHTCVTQGHMNYIDPKYT